jgi:hypothetical protein
MDSISALRQHARNHILIAVRPGRLVLDTHQLRLVIPLSDLKTLLPSVYILESSQLGLAHRPALLPQTLLACLTQLVHVRRVSGREISLRSHVLCNNIGHLGWEAELCKIHRTRAGMVWAANISVFQRALQKSSRQELADVVEECRDNCTLGTSYKKSGFGDYSFHGESK